MKTKLLSFVFSAACLSAMAQENLVVNGGLEFGDIDVVNTSATTNFYDFSYKNLSGQTTYSITNETSREGNRCAKLEVAPATTFKNRYDSYLSQKNLDVKESSTGWVLTFFAKTNKPAEFQAYLEGYTIQDDSKTTAGNGYTSVVIPGDNEWHSVSINISATPATGKTWNYAKPFNLNIGFKPNSTFADGATIYYDDIYLRLNNSSYWLNTGNMSFETRKADNTYAGLSAGDLTDCSELVTDCVHGAKAIKIDFADGTKSLETYSANPIITKKSLLRICFYAKSTTEGQTIQPFFKFLGKVPGQENVHLSNEWKKYSILYNVSDEKAAANTKDLQRIAFTIQPGNTYLDFVTMDSLSNNTDGTLRYVAPVIEATPSSLTLAINESSTIKPEIKSNDYVFVKATCTNADLEITNNGPINGITVKSAKDGNYDLKLVYTDGYTTVERDVNVVVGSGSSNVEENFASQVIATGRDGYISIRNNAGKGYVFNNLGIMITEIMPNEGEQIISVPGSAYYIIKFTDGSSIDVFVY